MQPPRFTLRLLGLHFGPDFGPHVAAALANVSLHHARRLLQSLKDAHLIQASGRDRYQLHDVLRVYAVELADAEEPDRAEAAVRCAAQAGEHWIAARFPRALWSYFDLRKPWSDWITTYEIGLSSVRHIDNRMLEGWITSALGAPYADLQRFDKAADYFKKAAAIHREIGDIRGLAGSLSNLGNARRHQARFDEALECLQEALVLRTTVADRRGEAVTLNRIGAVYRDLGRFENHLTISVDPSPYGGRSAIDTARVMHSTVSPRRWSSWANSTMRSTRTKDHSSRVVLSAIDEEKRRVLSA